MDEVVAELSLNIERHEHSALNERSWGILEGTSREPGKRLYTEGDAETWRAWDARPGNGESLADVYAKLIPYFEKVILPDLLAGKNVLVIGHAAMLKPLQAYLENIPHENAYALDFENCEAKIYEFSSDGTVVSVSSRKA